MKIRQQLIKCKRCPRFISLRIAKRNAGLCGKCLGSALGDIAEQLSRRPR